MPVSFSPSLPRAVLALADGSIFSGYSVGVHGTTAGEAVFNTSMTGYQEILTDPSYCRQIVTLTYPHIGNVGTNAEDEESAQIHAAGLVIHDLPLRESNFRSQRNLSAYLQKHKIVAVSGIDTRRLTRILRSRGAQNAAMIALPPGKNIDRDIMDNALAAAQRAPSMVGQDLARVVTTSSPYDCHEGEWEPGRGFADAPPPDFHVVAYDFGVKNNILRMLAQRGCRLTVVPAQTSAAQVLSRRPDGIFFSNGPGDPQACTYAIAAVRELLSSGIPCFGICLGHQLMALAAGAKTYKMKFGHHGANHPVRDLDTGRVCITSQNHGFAVDAATLPKNVRITHTSLFDGSLQGLEWTDRPAFSFQGHPEASPGPQDVSVLFDRFIKNMAAAGARRLPF